MLSLRFDSTEVVLKVFTSERLWRVFGTLGHEGTVGMFSFNDTFVIYKRYYLCQSTGTVCLTLTLLL